MTAVIIGANGGLGRALTLGLQARGYSGEIHAFARSGGVDWPDGIVPGRIDILDEDSIAVAAARVGEPDLVLIATGILSGPEGLKPEKSSRDQSISAYEQAFRINTVGPGLVAKHFLPVMPRRGRTVFAALSARVGSISDNRLGGWHAYRASKAALNMLIRNFAIEQSRRNPDAICVGLHPGTVDTRLSEPFQTGVPDAQLFSPEQSAGYLLDVLDNLSPEQSGRVFDWKGEEVLP